LQLRGDIEKNKNDAVLELTRLDIKMNEVARICYETPAKIRECERKCTEAEILSRQLVENVDTVIH